MPIHIYIYVHSIYTLYIFIIYIYVYMAGRLYIYAHTLKQTQRNPLALRNGNAAQGSLNPSMLAGLAAAGAGVVPRR